MTGIPDHLLRNGERKILLDAIAAPEGVMVGVNSQRSRDRLLERGYLAQRPDSRRYAATDAGRAWAADTLREGVWEQWTANATERRQWIQARDRLVEAGHRGLPDVR
jgi:hypothetical protein